MTRQIVSIGECMIEMSGASDGTWGMGFAGDSFNTLWYARAGLDPAHGAAAYVSAVGDDPFSDRMISFMERGGIDTAGVRRIPGGKPGLYLIEQRDGDRAFTYWRETAAARRLADDEATLRDALAGARCVYFSGITLAILPPEGRERLCRIAGEAREAGAIVAFDPNIRPALWESEDARQAAIMAGAAAASVILPSFDDETAAFGDENPAATIERYRTAGADEVAVKNGGGAILAAGKGEAPFETPAREGVTVVDATAAGDSFNGAYLAARLRGEGVSASVTVGRDMAAVVVGTRGGIVEMETMRGWQVDPR